MPYKKKKKKHAAKNEHADVARANLHEHQLLNMTDDVLNRFIAEDEVKTLRNILKTSDLGAVPLIIGATVLNKLDLMDDLIRKGVNVNEPNQGSTSSAPNSRGFQHGATALIWAIKQKNLDGVAILLEAGANVTVQSPNGDHLIFTALDSKLWDEESFIFLWNHINDVTAVDSNLLNKSGNSMMHIAVRREWFSFLDLLIEGGADVDIANNNGVTPLMLASFRNNLEMIDKFIGKGADVVRQDRNGFFPLCYAFSSAIAKHLRPPDSTAKRLLRELKRKSFSWEEYIQKRLEMILSFTDLQQQHNGQPISTMLLHILAYIARHTKNGLKILLNLNVFQKLKKVFGKCIDCPDRLRVMLMLAHEILASGEAKLPEMCRAFEASGCVGACLEVLKRYEGNETCDWLLPFAFRILVQVALTKGKAHEWLQTNLADLQHFCTLLENADLNDFDDKIEAHHNCKALLQDGMLPEEKMAEFKEVLGVLVENAKISNTQETQKAKSNSKKAKRRTKALKAKMAKIKSADLTERLNLNGKKILLQKKGESEPKTVPEEKPALVSEDDCHLVNSIKQLLDEDDDEVFEERLTFAKLHWKTQILRLAFNSKPKNDFGFETGKLRIFKNTPKITRGNVEEIVRPAVKYLQAILKKIIDKYRIYWIIDKVLETECRKITKERKSEEEEQAKVLEKMEEEEQIEVLQAEFNGVVSYVKETAMKDVERCRKLLKDAERILLSHEVRGTTIFSEVCPMEAVNVNVCTSENLDLPNSDSAEDRITKYMEDVLNNRRESMEDIKITVTQAKISTKTKTYASDDALYLKEMKAVPKAKKPNPKLQHAARMKTLKSAYHLQPSFLDFHDDFEDDFNNPNGVEFVYHQTTSRTITFFARSVGFCDGDAKTSRWCTLVRSLAIMEDCQEYLGGRVRISSKKKRQRHVISTGGNFTPVELGLDSCNRPLAVKRIPKGSWVCKTIKSMLSNLLNLRHKNLLHYFACEYDGNELIIATPLCEYNIGQYLVLMKQNQSSLTAVEVVKQFLAGLLFLHDRPDPIVHGNLKPSNTFVDINGVVRIAEFGIHKALFKFKEAPNSSVIWFATETFRTFKQLSTMECTIASDIHVAGMLVHFVMNAGNHPYGDDMRTILKNMEKATPQLSSNDLELEDLITWMLLSDPGERPSIQQVVTHVFFWSSERKWRFILTCAGLGEKLGSFKLNELHVCLEKVAFKDNIKGKWVQVVKQKFPKVSFANNDDTPTGLLKFIRTCLDAEDSLCLQEDLNLSGYILKSFPAFALSLYRMLENSVWVKHSTFSSFYSIEG